MPTDLRLPGASVSYPHCGACHEETDYDGDDFYCDGCGLNYDSNSPESPATYREYDAEMCGAISPKEPHNSEHKGKWYRFTEHPCPLPKGHKPTNWLGDHHYPSEATEIPAPEATND